MGAPGKAGSPHCPPRPGPPNAASPSPPAASSRRSSTTSSSNASEGAQGAAGQGARTGRIGLERQRLVFATPTGQPLDPANLTRRFRSLLDQAGLCRIRFHDLRYLTAALLLEQGGDLVVIKELLGHAHIGITASGYAHVQHRL
ncbi:tyrosine-type recombinase/integrase (plasmid) [Streptomyces sp. BB1-1-1]|uniref:tyrosine-type recombinase/integrase n=1 Tax=Streptomyces sp. BB1-1-1 TaxID=3074430 RepID=UPI0028772CC3|nr:tyrosine-type recombinase/integrase [Streptomyces sp. BB1-1-1]WND32826.1 tyrosine-type recombinase/integrase [Streptomyces sp. BB1-1-1]WND40106.1 tyrosine-type recombinase/integrase [Streptomyces sp. BB1-1-1]WND40938.1 tyrosine-type recombinase/integrase [Streptomyces sp. BB1-1-1]